MAINKHESGCQILRVSALMVVTVSVPSPWSVTSTILAISAKEYKWITKVVILCTNLAAEEW